MPTSIEVALKVDRSGLRDVLPGEVDRRAGGSVGLRGLCYPFLAPGMVGDDRLKDLGFRMVAASLFIRDRFAQGATDLMVAHLRIGPFGVATGVLRIAAVLQAATVTTKAISGHLQVGSVLDVAMAGIFCWVCVFWSNLTAAAARRPPRLGVATASALRRDDYLPLILMIAAFLAWDLWDLVASTSPTEALTTVSDIVQGLCFLLGSTLWRDPPRSRRRMGGPVASMT